MNIAIIVATLRMAAALPDDSRGCALNAGSFERIRDCRAESCLKCASVPATCTSGNSTSSGANGDGGGGVLHCAANVTGCDVVQCRNCEICSGVYFLSAVPGQYSHTSVCVSLSSRSPCDAVASYNCVGEGVAVTATEGYFYCNCHGENCTASLTQRYSIPRLKLATILPSLSDSVAGSISAREMTTDSLIVSSSLSASAGMKNAKESIVNGSYLRRAELLITVPMHA